MACEKHEELITEIAIVKTKVDNLENKVESLDDIKQLITRLTVLEEQRDKRDIDKDAIRKQHSETLEKLSVSSIQQTEALTTLSKTIEATDKRLTILDQKNDEKFAELDTKVECAKNKGNFNWIDLVTNKLIPLALISGVIYLIINLK